MDEINKNSAQKCSVVIPIAANDFPGLNQHWNIIKNNLGFQNIVVIGPLAIKSKVKLLGGASFVDEDDVFPGMTYEAVRQKIGAVYPKAERRAGWYFQQFLKMAYATKCASEYYMSWDSDTLPIKKMIFFNKDGKPYFDVLPEQSYDRVYFSLLDKISSDEIDFHKNESCSFITEHMMFSSCLMKKMINYIERNNSLAGDSFWEKIINSIAIDKLNLSGFSEFETYAAYVLNNHPDTYEIRQWKNLRNGKYYVGKNPSKEILNWIGEEYDVLSIEDYDSYSFVMALLLSVSNLNKLIQFRYIYSILNPIYKVKYKVRMLLRNIVRA